MAKIDEDNGDGMPPSARAVFQHPRVQANPFVRTIIRKMADAQAVVAMSPAEVSLYLSGLMGFISSLMDELEGRRRYTDATGRHLASVTALVDEQTSATTVEINCQECGVVALPTMHPVHLATLVKVCRHLLGELQVTYDADSLEVVGQGDASHVEALRAESQRRIAERRVEADEPDDLPAELRAQLVAMLGDAHVTAERVDQVHRALTTAAIPPDLTTARALLFGFAKLAPMLGPPHLIAILVMQALGAPFGIARVDMAEGDESGTPPTRH